VSPAGAHRIDVIGIDDSGLACLTPAEAEIIDQATLLCGGARHLALFPGVERPAISIGGDLDSFYRTLAAWDCGPVAVLASGDPCYFGIGPLLAERFGGRVSIHPRPSSVAMAFARLGIAWQDATVVSVHGRPIAEALPAVLRASKVAILTDAEHTPAVMAEVLLAAGMDDCRAFVFERLGGTQEQIHEHHLSEIPGRRFDALNVLILLPDGPYQTGGGFGHADTEFESLRGQITKAEVRAIALARLEPWRATTCWDVGAGCGSVSIEAASLMPTPNLHAIERDPQQLAVMHRNLARHRSTGVHLVEGSAPEVLDALPPPDAVFVGGGGQALTSILEVTCKRLRPGGRLVANFARLESLSDWRAYAASTSWQAELVEVNVARGEPLADGTRLAPLGAVFVTRLIKPEAVG
jgi:precorrin-6B C5,15-methyltransferase / cobalt-precorrin-6B C5,C15-methyltransferase